MNGIEPDGTDRRRSDRVRLVDDRVTGSATQTRPTIGAATDVGPSATPTVERESTSHDHDHDHDPHDHDHAHDHAHEHEHGDPGPRDGDGDGLDRLVSAGTFPHEKLDAYRVALQMTAVAKQVAAQIPRGNRSIADHLLRAAANVVLLLAEGANRRGAGEKRQRFVESRGECGEVAAAADLVVVLDLGPQADAETLKRLAGRVSAMLTGLIGRLG